MQSLKHIKAYLFLHGKNVSKKAVDKFLSILQADIKSGKITKAKDKFTKEVDRIQRSLVGMSNVMLPNEVVKVEIEAPSKKHYERIVVVGAALGSIIPAMVSGAAGKVTEAIILNLFKAKTGLSGLSGKGTLLASAPTEEKILAIINKYFYSTTFKLVDGVLHNSKGPVNNFSVEQKKGRYRFMQNESVSGTEGVDLFEDHENIPAKLQKVLDKHSKAFEDGNYDLLAKALKAVEKIGYTFEYYVDGSAYDLRKIGEKGKSESISGIKTDEKKLKKYLKNKKVRLTHGYKLAKRKKGKKKAVKNRKPKTVKPIKKVAAKKTKQVKKKASKPIVKKVKPVKKIEVKKIPAEKTKAPKSKVKASVTAAIADLLTLDKYQKYGAMFLGMFYSTFKNSDVVGDKIGDMKEKMFSKYEFDLFEHDYHAKTIELTEKGKELIKSIEGRIDTLKAKKSGSDMFPELAGTKKKLRGPQRSARKQDGFVGVGTISETVDGVLAAMKAERSGVKKAATKKHNTHILPVYRKVEVMPVENVSAPAQTQVQTSNVKTEGTMSGAEMGSMTFEKLNFNDYYKGIFGSPATNFDMCIDGSPGSGKTTFLLMFANYLADFHGPTLFVTTEEFGSATLIDKVNRFNIKSKNLYFAKKVPALDELKKYKFVFIDSINHAKITIEQYQAMREKAAKTAFILVLQQTKSGSYKGSTDWPHEVEITMSLFKDEFDERNLKISKDRYTDPVPRVVKI